eukprot:7055342-Prymnesium_polylepis.2
MAFAITVWLRVGGERLHTTACAEAARPNSAFGRVTTRDYGYVAAAASRRPLSISEEFARW